MKEYKLLKDSPELKAGSVVEWDEEEGMYAHDDVVFSKTVVEDNPEWFAPVEVKKRWRAELHELYSAIDSFGQTVQNRDWRDGADNYRYAVGNYYRTAEEAIRARDKTRLIQKLKDYALEHNGEWEVDTQDKFQVRFIIAWDLNEWTVSRIYGRYYPFDIYFASREVGKAAIEHFGERLNLLLE